MAGFEEDDGFGVEDFVGGFGGRGFGGGDGFLGEGEVALAVAQVGDDADGELAEEVGVFAGVVKELAGFGGRAVVVVAGEFLVVGEVGGEAVGAFEGGEVVFPATICSRASARPSIGEPCQMTAPDLATMKA